MPRLSPVSAATMAISPQSPATIIDKPPAPHSRRSSHHTTTTTHHHHQHHHHRPHHSHSQSHPQLRTASAAAATTYTAVPPPSLRHARPAVAHLSSSSSTSSTSSSSNKMSEYRHLRSGSLNIPSTNSTTTTTANMTPATPSQGRFDGPRSPPNTSHVPCKFFRQGACQAGPACPFSHDLSLAAETICKYFAKGNCKFGPKCANVHVLADGRRINYGKNGITIGQPLHLGNRVNPALNNHNSALTNSFMHADSTASYAFPGSPNGDSFHTLDRQPSLENGLPTIDTTYSHTSSQYGSPREEDPSRLGLGLSPVTPKGLSVLDAPLPASFDSNGISNAARYPGGPWPSSVPSQFGLESPSPSLNSAKDARTSDTLKLLHHSAFGGNEHLSAALHASSPPAQPSDEYFGKRPMHSSRYPKPKMLSSSAPRAIASAIDRDWDSDFSFLEEDYLPDNLKDLLTPAEKARRGSRAAEDDPTLHRHNGSSASGAGTPNAETTSKFGSPLAASPSRWGPLFQRQHEDHEAKKHAAAASAGVFGHVGSPLRNSSLSAEIMRPQHGGRSGSIDGLSALTQQLQRTRVDNNSNGGESPRLHPHSHIARPSNGRGSERHVSSSSISSSARYTTPIGEEDGEFVFSMDEDGDRDTALRTKKRQSGAGAAVTSPWSNSYASIAAAAGKKEDGSSRVVESVGGR